MARTEERREPRIEAVTFHQALRELRKRMYTYNMNIFNPMASEEYRETCRQELVKAAKFLGSWDDPPEA